MQYIDAHLVIRQFKKGLFDCLDGTLHIALNDNVEPFDLTLGNFPKHIVQRNARLHFDHRLALFTLAFVKHLFEQLILLNRNDRIAGIRHFF